MECDIAADTARGAQTVVASVWAGSSQVPAARMSNSAVEESAPGGGLGAWGRAEPLGGGGQLAIQTVVQLNRQARSGGSTSRKSSAGQVTCEVESN